MSRSGKMFKDTDRSVACSAYTVEVWEDSCPVGAVGDAMEQRVIGCIESLPQQPKKAIVMVHDQDGVKTHAHCVMWFGRGVALGPVADAFGIKITQVPDYRKSSGGDGLKPLESAEYLLHWGKHAVGKDGKEKFQYPLERLLFLGDWVCNGKDSKADIVRKLKARKNGVDPAVTAYSGVLRAVDNWAEALGAEGCTTYGFLEWLADRPDMDKDSWCFADRSVSVRRKIDDIRNRKFRERLVRFSEVELKPYGVPDELLTPIESYCRQAFQADSNILVGSTEWAPPVLGLDFLRWCVTLRIITQSQLDGYVADFVHFKCGSFLERYALRMMVSRDEMFGA